MDFFLIFLLKIILSFNQLFPCRTLEVPSEPDAVAMRFQYEDDEDGADKMEKIVLEFSDDKFDCQSVASMNIFLRFRNNYLH